MCIMTARKRGNKIEDWRKCKVVKLADGASSRRSQAVLKRASKEAAAARSGWRGTDQEDARSRLVGSEVKLLKLEPTLVSPCCTFDPEAAAGCKKWV